MWRIILKKLSQNDNALRTPVVKGFSSRLPKVGESFSLFSEPINPNAAFRQTCTSEIMAMSVIPRNGHYFKLTIYTENSIYLLTLKKIKNKKN